MGGWNAKCTGCNMWETRDSCLRRKLRFPVPIHVVTVDSKRSRRYQMTENRQGAEDSTTTTTTTTTMVLGLGARGLKEVGNRVSVP